MVLYISLICLLFFHLCKVFCYYSYKQDFYFCHLCYLLIVHLFHLFLYQFSLSLLAAAGSISHVFFFFSFGISYQLITNHIVLSFRKHTLSLYWLLLLPILSVSWICLEFFYGFPFFYMLDIDIFSLSLISSTRCLLLSPLDLTIIFLRSLVVLLYLPYFSKCLTEQFYYFLW